jgi:hypothetical protein
MVGHGVLEDFIGAPQSASRVGNLVIEARWGPSRQRDSNPGSRRIHGRTVAAGPGDPGS